MKRFSFNRPRTLRLLALICAVVFILPSLVLAVIDPVKGFAFYGRFLMLGAICLFIFWSFTQEGKRGDLRQAGREPIMDRVSPPDQEARADRPQGPVAGAAHPDPRDDKGNSVDQLLREGDGNRSVSGR